MNWVIKAVSGKLLSYLPFHLNIYWYLQKNVIKTVTLTESMIKRHIERGLESISELVKIKKAADLLKAYYYDLGTGSYIIIPLVRYCIGINKQHLTDIRRNLDARIQRSSVEKMQGYLDYINEHNPLGTTIRNIPSFKNDQKLDEYLKKVGMLYDSPFDSRRTAFQNKSIDIISCTSVLQYPTHENLEKILCECYRILKNDGLFFIQVDLCDEFYKPDGNISIYNYLKYSDFVWNKIISSRLLSHNRYRTNDFKDLFKKAGFKIIFEKITPPTKKEFDELQKLKLNSKYRGMDLQDLGIKDMVVILGK